MKTFVIIGCGRFGSSVARTLFELGHEVMVIDKSEDIINDIANEVTWAIQADATDVSVLDDLGIGNFQVAIVSIGRELDSSIMATLAVKELGVATVIAKAQSEMHSKILSKIGADRVVYPEQDMGSRIAHRLSCTNILDYIEFSSDYQILEISNPENWLGKSLEELSLPKEFGINILSINRGGNIIVNPGKDDILNRKDTLTVLGSKEAVNKLEQSIGD